jgi:diguanylate cyclase (GGDEF)-like protein
MRLTFGLQRRHVAIIAVLALLAVNSTLFFVSLNRLNEASSWVKHSLTVQKGLASAHVMLLAAESGERGYLLTSDTQQLASYHEALSQLGDRLETLQRELADNPGQTQRFGKARDLARQRLGLLTEVVALHNGGDSRAAIERVGDDNGTRIMGNFRSLILAIETEEARLLDLRQREYQWAQVALYASSVIFIVGTVGLLGFLYVAMRRRVRERSAAAQASATYAASLDDGLRTLEKERNDIAQVNEASNFLQSCNTMDEVAKLSTSFLKSLFPGQAGAISVYAASRNQLVRLVAWSGAQDAEVFSPDECWGLRRGQQHVRYRSGNAPICSHVGCGGACDTICVPLVAHGETLGLMTLEQLDPTEAGSASDAAAAGLPDPRKVDMVARQLALTLANLRLRETLAEQSIRDPLTNSFNRRYLGVVAGKEIAKAQRFGRSLAVVMLDVDHFKRFNDVHGHPAGDAALIAVAAHLQEHTREGDWLFRLGGEEFALLLGEVGRDDARAKAEELREGIMAIVIGHQETVLPRITVSMGVAMYPDNGNELDALLSVADEALYAAKQSGRNRVVLAEGREADAPGLIEAVQAA